MVKWKRFTGGDFLIMEPKIHKRKNNHVVIVTSDAVDASVKQYRIGPGLMRVIVIILCVIIGSLVGYLSYEKRIWEAATVRLSENRTTIATLEEENKALQEEIASLTVKLEIMGETVQQEIAKEEAVRIMAATYLRPYSIDCILICIVFLMNGYFNGCGKSVISLVHSLVATFVFRVPLCFLSIERCAATGTLTPMGWCMPIASVASAKNFITNTL